MMLKLSLVRLFAQTGICLTERHAPFVFTNWVVLILHTELQLRMIRCYHTSGRVGAGPKPCTFPSGSCTNGKGLCKFISGHALSRGIFFSPLLLLLGLLSAWVKGVGGTKRSPWVRMLLFSELQMTRFLAIEGGSAECEANTLSESLPPAWAPPTSCQLTIILLTL